MVMVGVKFGADVMSKRRLMIDDVAHALAAALKRKRPKVNVYPRHPRHVFVLYRPS